jgi:hypothetical protein
MTVNQSTSSTASNTRPLWWKPVWPLFLVFAVLGLIVNFVVLLDFGPDEPFHAGYMHSLAFDRQLPDRKTNHLVQHPPLYYAVMALPWRVVSDTQHPLSIKAGPGATRIMTPRSQAARHMMRGLQTLLGVLSLALMARLLALLQVPPRWRWPLLGLVALWPMFAYISGVINNENAGILWSTLVCCAVVQRVLAGTCSVRQAVGLGLLVGGGALIKQTTLFVFPVALWAVLMPREDSPRAQRAVGFCAAMALAGLWWPLRNWLTVGEPFPTYTYLPVPQPWALVTDPLSSLGYVRIILETSFLPDWSWNFFPRELSTAMVAALALVIAILWWRGRQSRGDFYRTLQNMSLLAIASLLAGIMQYTIFKDYNAQVGGRYLLNSLAWLITFLGSSVVLEQRAASHSAPDEPVETAPAPSPPREKAYLIAVAALGVMALINLGWWFVVWTHYSTLFNNSS